MQAEEVRVKLPNKEMTRVVTDIQSLNDIMVDEVPLHILNIRCMICSSDADANPKDLRDGYVTTSILAYLPNPSAWVGYDTRSIFKQSLIGLNSEFSFS